MTSVLREEYLARICCGNLEAMDFLRLWARYAHEVDDVVDGDRVLRVEIVDTFALGITLFSHPFYLKNLAHLRGVMWNMSLMYRDTVAWEQAAQEWKRTVADALRCCGNEITFAVAVLCGGYDHARQVTEEHRELCWRNQHEDQDNSPHPTLSQGEREVGTVQFERG